MKLLRMVTCAVACLCAGTTACRDGGGQGSSPSPLATPPADSARAMIWVTMDGTVELNGKSVTLDVVGAELGDLARRDGVVLYGRDASEQEPHPNGMRVIELVAQNRLPIRMCTKRDFSDAMGQDGKLKP